jgi:UDP-GlcNAc:undecaprenyl-phosphate GlcNAc-1-phosphate transferase
LILVGALTPIVSRFAIRLDVVDRPTEAHKTHRSPVPYLGGLAIVIGVVVTAYGAIFISGDFALLGLASTVLLPAICIGIMGLIDDIKKLSPWPRFLVQNTIGLVIAVVLVSTNTLGAPVGNQILDVLISIFWIVAITNSINFFDNIDGGASGTVAISSFFLFLLAFQGGQDFIAAMSIVLSGATAGFLMWNKAPARIYMGDAGALFLGVLIASLTLRFDPNPIEKFAGFAVPVLLLAVPLLDTTVVVISRLKRGISPFQGGQDHLSHRLMQSHFVKRQAVISLWILSIFFSLIALLISNAPFELERALSILAFLIWLVALITFSKMRFTL